MWRKSRLILILSLTLLALVACAKAAQVSVSSREEAIAGGIAPDELPATDGSYAYANPGTSGQTSQVLPADPERLIIRIGDLSLVVTDTEEAMAAITQMAESNRGWVVSSSLYQYTGNAKTGVIVIRIPADGFNSAFTAIKALALEVTSESTNGQDVTEEYVDLEARLGNLEATAARVRGFLADADKVEDALAVNQELSRLEGEIEAIKGRMQYLGQSAAFSTITVNLTPDELAQPIEVAGWRPEGVARDAVESLIQIIQALATLVIWLAIVLIPVGLLLGLPIWGIMRLARRRRERQATPPSAA